MIVCTVPCYPAFKDVLLLSTKRIWSVLRKDWNLVTVLQQKFKESRESFFYFIWGYLLSYLCCLTSTNNDFNRSREIYLPIIGQVLPICRAEYWFAECLTLQQFWKNEYLLPRPAMITFQALLEFQFSEQEKWNAYRYNNSNKVRSRYSLCLRSPKRRVA